MNNKKKIYIALAVLAIIILGIGIILNFTSNQKQPIKSDSTAKYSLKIFISKVLYREQIMQNQIKKAGWIRAIHPKVPDLPSDR